MTFDRQRDRLLCLFQANEGRPVALPVILALGIAQYNARIYELRREGYIIENEIVDIVDGARHTAFTYKGKRR